MALVKPTGRKEREETHNGFPFKVVSFKLGGVFKAMASNVSPDAVIARGQGATREEAESLVLETARRRLGRTRRFDV